MMRTKTLGRTGWEVTQLGYGSMGLRGAHTWGVRVVSEAAAEQFVHNVLDCGINFIDTAPDYGISEARIGKFLASRRSEFYLATKCGCAPIQHRDHLEVIHDWNRETVQRNLETSLKRLQTDHIDLLQFHGGSAEVLQQAGLIDLLKDWQSQGVIGYVGVSSKLPEITDLIRLEVFDTFQIPYSCLSPAHDDSIRQAAATGAGIIIRGGIAQGGPQAEIQRPALNEVWSRAGLQELLPEGMTAAELLLRFTLSHPDCHTTIVGTCNLQHLKANLAAAEAGPLSAELVEQIKQRVADLEIS